MGWFDEQIRQRMKRDEAVFEDSFLRMAGSVLGGSEASWLYDERLEARHALDEILKYYRYKPVEIPEELTDTEAQFEYALRPLGLMTRDVELTEGWYKDAYGPMLGFMADSGAAVALLPGRLHGYRFTDPDTGKRVRVTRENAKRLDRAALCFYRPLPMKKLGIPDLLLYLRSCITSSDIAVIMLATLSVVLVGMIEPKVSQVITGPVLKSRNLSLLMGMAVFLIASAFAAQLLQVTKDLLSQRISQKTALAVEASVMMRILSLPVSFFRRFSSGELSSRADSVGSLCDMLLENTMFTGLTSLMSLLYIGQIFSFAPKLVWPSIAIIMATVLLSLATSLTQIRISRQKMKLNAAESGMSYAMVSGIQKIRLSGAEKRAFARWAKVYAQNTALEYNPPPFLKLNGVLNTGIMLVGNIVLYYIAASSGVAPNEYFAFSAAYGRVMGAFSALASIAIAVASIPPVLEMAEPILKAEPEVASDKEVITRVGGGIEMNHVSFRYEPDTPYVLNDLSLRIRPGEYVAIVGRTGCGKSTLIRLLLGFEQPEKGAIYYDGKNLKRIDPRSLRKQMGVVLQNGQLMQGDIFSNIVISAPQLTLEDAWAAAETAGIADDIRDMPMGMQTVISEGQGGISGGQKQRLMIARAIAPKPKILIFDEATSALDNKTQRQVSEALDALKCTRVVIAHRLSTIRNCDRILVMDGGAIVEEGTYDQLITLNGRFAELVARQRLDDAKPPVTDV
ncbi:MAG: NHLP bacteriocin export ABC transporter permease/ATPase subunit [Clostridia bacterium]|nr:NHLP bacteriocin export ABC transporter permease/ATPase subunit [Clostridia bacterium]